MSKKLLAVLLGVIMITALFAGCGGGGSSSTPAETAPPADTEPADDTPATEETAPEDTGSDDDYKVILITMDSTDLHWVSVDKGAQEAAAEFGVDYKWMAPDRKDDAQQIERVNNAIADGADAIVIAANGPDAIVAALNEAKAEGIQIVYVDSPANAEAFATFSTNNYAAGVTAGETMLSALEEAGVTEGKIGIVNINTATDSTNNREAGFREALEGTAFEILETQYGEGDAAKSQDIADNFITEGVVGLYGTNEGATVGVGNAIKGAGGGIIGVGFDQSDAILSLVQDGSLVGVMAQNPEVMGYEGVKAAVAAIKGETIPETQVDTGVSVITAD